MRFQLVSGDTVLIQCSEQVQAIASGTTAAGAAASGASLLGLVSATSGERIELSIVDGTAPWWMRQSSSFILRKVTSFGILECGMQGRIEQKGSEATISGRLEGTPRMLQRRDSCRIELRTPARYSQLTEEPSEQTEWNSAELGDVSLSGASLVLQALTSLAVGSRILLEFALQDERFSVQAVVVRRSGKANQAEARAGLEFTKVDMRQQDRLARAIVHLQLKHISSRVKLD